MTSSNGSIFHVTGLFVRGIHRPPVNSPHRSPVNSPHKGQWRRALIFSLICTWINGWVNNQDAGDLRRNRAHYDVIVMLIFIFELKSFDNGIGCRQHAPLVQSNHDDVIKWKHFPRYWPFVRGIHRSAVNSRTKASDAELWCFLWSASE